MELKAFVARKIDDGSCDPVPCIEVYHKSEADKVIADLEEKLKNSRNARKYWMKEYLLEDKECIHHKFKRCLAMAKLCRSVWAAAIFIPEKGGTDKQAALYMKWENRWLSLAEKFKEVE